MRCQRVAACWMRCVQKHLPTNHATAFRIHAVSHAANMCVEHLLHNKYLHCCLTLPLLATQTASCRASGKCGRSAVRRQPPRAGLQRNARRQQRGAGMSCKAAVKGRSQLATLQLERPFRHPDVPEARVGGGVAQTSTDSDGIKGGSEPHASAGVGSLRGEAPGNAAPDADAAPEPQPGHQPIVTELAHMLAKLPRHVSSAEVLNGVQLAMPEICRCSRILSLQHRGPTCCSGRVSPHQWRCICSAAVVRRACWHLLRIRTARPHIASAARCGFSTAAS